MRTSIALVLLLAACGGSTSPNCDALRACCASLSSSANACTDAAHGADEAACGRALQAVQSAGLCKDTKQPVDNGEAGPSCGRYLSCLLLTAPEAYGAAIQVYGKDAACWATPQQTAGCNQACDAAFARIESLCECTGSTCTKCQDVAGTYYMDFNSSFSASCDAQGAGQPRFDYMSLRLDGTTVTAEVHASDGTYKLTGERACSGSFQVTGNSGDSSGFGCASTYTVTLTPSADGKGLQANLVETRTCYTDPPFKCTASASLRRN